MPLTKVSSGVIAANAVQDSVGSQSITGDKLGLTAINANNIVSGAVTGDKIGATSINANNIVGGTITTTQIASNTISNTNIQTGAIENYSRATGLLSGMRNRIINGAMRIDQRNAGAAVTPANADYTLDRFQAVLSQSAKYSVQQDSSANTVAGFTSSLKVTSLSAYSVGASELFTIQQPIEGFNTADLNWGTANAKNVTLSFWVRSSLTGTFGGSFTNSAGNRNYPFSYTISSANTWEQKFITVDGDTSGTWIGATNGVGILIRFGLGVGSTVSGPAGAWSGSTYYSATGATSVVGTNGATFYITGVQLEVGSTATSFDYRPHGTELDLCMRYFNRMTIEQFTGINGFCDSTTDFISMVMFPVPMRTNPSFTSTSAGSVLVIRKAGAPSTINTTDLYQTSAGTKNARIFASVSSGLTAGAGGAIAAGESQTGFMAWSAEL